MVCDEAPSPLRSPARRCYPACAVLDRVSQLIDEIPKVELHLHLEGTLEASTAFKLAARNQIQLPYSSERELAAAYHFSDLQSFLDIYYAVCAVSCN